MEHYDIFDTIGYIFCLICSDDFTATITSISDKCGIPVPMVRKYIYHLLKNKLLSTHIFLDYEIYDQENGDTWEQSSSKKLLEEISHGTYDNTEITFDEIETLMPGSFLIPFSSIEYECMKSYYPGMIDDAGSGTFEIKDIYGSVSNDILAIEEKLQSTITYHKRVEIYYVSPGKKAASFTCTPVQIIQDTTQHLAYLKDSENNLYRLDRIKCSFDANGKVRSGIQEVSDTSTTSTKPFSLNPMSKYYWAADNNENNAADKSTEKPIHVKIRVRNETRNLINKLKKDVILRAETSKLYIKDGSWYYEDDILGINDFRRWLRGYGSSLVVLEPKSLIKQITSGYHKTLEYYDILEKQNKVFTHITDP